jgi:hypothetical protein
MKRTKTTRWIVRATVAWLKWSGGNEGHDQDDGGNNWFERTLAVLARTLKVEVADLYPKRPGDLSTFVRHANG